MKKEKEDKAAALKKEKEDKAAALKKEKEDKAAALKREKEDKKTSEKKKTTKKNEKTEDKNEKTEDKKTEDKKTEERKETEKKNDVITTHDITLDLTEEEYQEEDEQPLPAKKFTFKGKVYLKGCDTNVIYDKDTQEVIGEWEEKTNTIYFVI